MKLFFLFVILIGLFKPNFSLEQTTNRETEVGDKSSKDESGEIKVPTSDLESVADLVFAKLKIELDKQKAAMKENFAKIDGTLSQLKERITKSESHFTDFMEGAIRDNNDRHLALKEDLKIMATQMEAISSNCKLDHFQQKWTNADAPNVVILSNGENETQSWLLKIVKESADAKTALKSDERLVLLEQEMKNLHEITHGFSSIITSDAKNLKFIYQSLKCDLSRNLNMTILSNGKQYFYDKTKKLSWHEMKEFCEQHGMMMVSLDTMEEFKAIALQDPTKWSYWLAANDIGREPGEFRWANGAKVNDFFPHYWYDSFEKGKETCLYLFAQRMGDYACNNTEYVLCKRADYCKLN